jgi:alkyl hydroperoxide reductase subunit AhpF
MTALIDKSVEEMVKERLRGMKEPVTLKVFSKKGHCLFCNEMINLMESVAKLNDKIAIDKCDCSPDDPESQKYNVQRHPAVAILGDKDYGIRFFGVPAGKEFTTLIESIMLVSERTVKLPAKVMEM